MVPMMMDITPNTGIIPPLPSPSLPVLESAFAEYDDMLVPENMKWGDENFHFGPGSFDQHDSQPPSSQISPHMVPKLLRESSRHKSKRGLDTDEDNSSAQSVSTVSSIGSDSSERRSKRRQLLGVDESAGQSEFQWTTNLDHSQALSGLQCQADRFSQSLMQQNFGAPTDNSGMAAGTIEIGTLLAIVDSFMTLLSTVIRSPTEPPSIPSPPQAHRYNSPLRRVQSRQAQSSTAITTSSGLIVAENLEPNDLDSGMLHLFFGCHNRLLFAFQVCLDAITNQVVGGWSHVPDPFRLDLLSIGSYRVPEGTELNILLHLYTISHQLDIMDAALRRCVQPSTSKQSIAALFQSRVCKEKRQRLGMESLKERALMEAAEHKSILNAKIEHILKRIKTVS